MKTVLKFLPLILMFLFSCGGNDCPENTWCDKGDVKEYFIDNQKYNSPSLMGLMDLRITYNKTSKLFELQIILENGSLLNFVEDCYTPKIQIRGGEWKNEDVLEDVRILDKTDRKLSFKSLILEKTFEDKGVRLERNELYGVYFDFEKEYSYKCRYGRQSKLFMIWGM